MTIKSSNFWSQKVYTLKKKKSVYSEFQKLSLNNKIQDVYKL